MAKQHGLNAVTSPRPLLEHFPRYRAEHPIGPETTRLTLIGFPVGALRRRAMRMTIAMSVFALVVLLAEPQPIAAAALALVVLPLAMVCGPRGDRPIGIAITDRRTVIAQRRGRGATPHTVEWPRGAITHAALRADVERFWLAGRVHRVDLTGPDGDVASIEVTQLDPTVLDQLLGEAGIAVDLRRRAAAPRRWGPAKAFVVGTLFTLGVPVAFVAGASLLQRRDTTSAAAALAGLVLTGTGEGLRRVLFSRPSRRDEGG